METYYCKRYRRSSPGGTAGTLTDTAKFSADSTAEAENTAKRYYLTGIAHMDWDKYFATLEDESGKLVAEWREGIS